MQADRSQGAPSYAEHPDLAIVALLFMLARYPNVRCARMSDSILAHLRYVASDVRYPDSIREAAANIFQEWQFAQAPDDRGSAWVN